MNTPLINNIANKSISTRYLPNKEKYGEEYGGYRNKTEEIIFNKFAATSNDVSFIYNNIKYYIYKRDDIVKVYNANIKEIIKEYLNETEFLESFSINGIPFIELIDEISDVNAYIDVFTPHLALDKEGFPYNCKYPPNKEKFGDLYDGYKNKAEGVLFYDFGIRGYDVSFKYKRKYYYLLTEPDHVAVCDEHFTKEYESYENAMTLIENFKIDGKPLIELTAEIMEIEPE